jgi:hypothetical protein
LLLGEPLAPIVVDRDDQLADLLVALQSQPGVADIPSALGKSLDGQAGARTNPAIPPGGRSPHHTVPRFPRGEEPSSGKLEHARMRAPQVKVNGQEHAMIMRVPVLFSGALSLGSLSAERLPSCSTAGDALQILSTLRIPEHWNTPQVEHPDNRASR